MTDETKLVAWFEEVGKNDIPLVGGKGANLGELTNNGIAVPPGFIVTSEAYIKFLKSSKLSDTIRLHLSNLDINDSKKLQDVASIIKNKFTEFPMPAKLITQIKQAYRKLGGGMVAVRSSATAEDQLLGISF